MLLQLVFIAATGTAIWYGSRWVTNEIRRVDTQMERLHKALDMANVSRTPRLQFNPATGVYQPVRLREIRSRLLA